jgi:tRNA A-37 threonylcarbamoyl transferase component Bud32
MGEKTVRPGRYSFTSLLIVEFRQQLAIQKFVVVAIAHKNIASKDSPLVQSAVYFPFEKKNGTTRLEPFKKPGSSHIETVAEAASLVLQLSITDNDRQAFEEVIEWLKLNPPRTVSKVVVENIITSASAVYHYASSQEDGSRSMASFKKLPEPAKMDISSTWSAFTTTIAALATSVGKFPPLLVSSDSLDRSDVSGEFLHQLDRHLKPLESAIERNVMSLPELNDKAVLLKAIDDKMMEDLGFAQTLNLRLVAHFNARTGGSSGLKADLDSSTIKADGPFLNLSVQDISPLGRVLVECKDYDGSSTDKRIVMASNQRMEKLAELLNSSKSADFHTLNCLRFFDDPQRGRSGLIFEIPEGSRQCQISLRDIIRKIVGKYKPTLGQRFQIAHNIGKAIAKWHLVGWVHQGIASHNIVFFYDETYGVDYSQPYLCGFEYSRESGAPSTCRFVENFELNVYRHPDRQGTIPSKFHRKEHDIYAYGVLLLEIGLWKLAERFFDDKEKMGLTPYAMGQKILRTSKELLGHSMDTQYERAASTCLSGDFGLKQDDLAQSRLAAAFETQVLEKIGRGVVIDEY